MSEIIYEFTAKHATVDWETTPEKMVDGTETSYAETTNDGEVQLLITNECDGSDLGTISMVEMRAYGYGDEDDRVYLRAVYVAGDGYNTPETPGATPGWTGWRDKTEHPNAPSPWTWSDVQALDCDVEFTKVAKGNTMHIGMVQIRVTYTTGPTPGWNKLQYTSEPPTPNAWNQLKRDAGTGDYKKLLFEGE